MVKQRGECLVFKVAGKVFFLIALDAGVIDGVTQAPCCAKRHWVRVGDLDAFPEKELSALIRHSYELVVARLPGKVQATPPPPAPGFR